MKNTIYTQNRELSWLRFNERVMEEAVAEDVPAFERLKFLSIFTSNLDEFFMIRVGSLYDQTFLPKPSKDNKTGMTPSEQLREIFGAVAPLYKKRDRLYGDVAGQLAEKGIVYKECGDFTQEEKKFTEYYFESYVQPILSPQIINALHPFPHLVNKNLYIALLLKIGDKAAFGIVPVPSSLERIICLPGGGTRYTLLENIVYEYADSLFDNCKIQGKMIVSVTRNADVNVSELAFDEDEDFRDQMKKVLKKRARLAPVRLEYKGNNSERLEKFFKEKLKLKKEQIFESKTPLEMSYVFDLLDRLPKQLAKEVTYKPFEPRAPLWFDGEKSMIDSALKRDLFLSYPYEKMEPFLQLVREAAADPRVVSIKITIYRLASKAALVDYLRMAAENGKEVTVLMELRARFDEENNINWSESLDDAGCTVIYGLKDYKVHSKVCQITMTEKGKFRRITQIGTGNYNEKTAKLYTDMTLITSDREICNDAAQYFKNMSIANLDGKYSELLVAPYSMKSRLLDMIGRECRKALRGEPARIRVKINSLTDREIIDALKDASQAGVKVDMIIRGICCLLPGVEGYTDNIRIMSIVGRFLEHSRVYCFGEGDDPQMYISSADFMTRNLNRRVEVACPIKDGKIVRRILDMMDIMFEDNVKGRQLNSRGIYEKIEERGRNIDSQQEFIEGAADGNMTEAKIKEGIEPGIGSREKMKGGKRNIFVKLIEFFR